MPDVMLDDRGYTVYHLCGDRCSIAANYPTLEDSISEWNKIIVSREPKKSDTKQPAKGLAHE